MSFTNQTSPVREVLKYFFKIPEYQRDYVWEEERAEDLVSSIIVHFLEYITREDDESRKDYFIGAVVFQKTDKDNTYYVVDGQQRLITLHLMISVCVNLLKKLGASSEIISKVSSDYLSEFNIDTEETTIKLQPVTDDMEKALKSLLRGQNLKPNDVSRSVENTYNAYNIIEKNIVSQLNIDLKKAESFSYFSDYLRQLITHLSHVTVLPFISTSNDESLTVFETLNSRGVGLTSLDIIKSLLYDRVREDEDKWDQMTEAWNNFIDKYNVLNINPNKFLRYLVVTHYSTSIKAQETLNWVRDNADNNQLNKSPLEFIKNMTTTAERIGLIQKGFYKEANPHPILKNIRLLASSSSQQLFFLLPVWDMGAEVFLEAAKICEAQIFVNKVLARYAGSTEKRFIEWGLEVKKKADKKAQKKYLEDKCWKEIQKEHDVIELQFLSVSWLETNRTFIKWILKRIEVELQTLAGETEIEKKGVAYYRRFDIEHVEPQNSDRFTNENIHNIGNLTVLERSYNRAVKDKPYNEKTGIYGKSHVYLTQSMNGHPEVGGKIKETFEKLKSFESWEETDVLIRAKMLFKILTEALNLR